MKVRNASVTLYVTVALAVLVLLASCVVQGMWSERWGEFPELELFSTQMEKIPTEFGEWKGREAEKSDEKILKIAGAAGELVRVYTNASGEEVRVSMICARLRDIFNHTPDRCYPAAGFEMEGDPQLEVFEIGNSKAEFYTTSFLKSEPSGTHRERGFWSWSADGTWQAPSNRKLKFAGKKALYKLYVFANIPLGKPKLSDHDFARDFIRAFVPVLEAYLSPAAEKVSQLNSPPKVETEAKADDAQPPAPPADEEKPKT